MGITIIDNESLKRLNAGETLDLDFGPLSATIASEKWVEKMKKQGNILEPKPCSFCESFEKRHEGDHIYKDESGQFHIMADTGDSFQWGAIGDVSYCPYCGRGLK